MQQEDNGNGDEVKPRYIRCMNKWSIKRKIQSITWKLVFFFNLNNICFNLTNTSFMSTNVKLRLKFDIHLTFSWPLSDLPWPSPDLYLTLIRRFLTSPELHLAFPDVHLTFTWPSDHLLTFPWPLPNLNYQISVFNPLQTLSQGLVLTLRFTFDPELDN